jgi:hypothetical protein
MWCIAFNHPEGKKKKGVGQKYVHQEGEKEERDERGCLDLCTRLRE